MKERTLKKWEARFTSDAFHERLKQELEKHLKGRDVTKVWYGIYYDFKDDEFFKVVQASGNWDFSPNEDTEGYVCVYSNGSNREGGDFSVEHYFWESFKTTPQVFENEVVEGKREEFKELIEDYWRHPSKVIKFVKEHSETDLKEVLDRAFEQDLKWLLSEAKTNIRNFLNIAKKRSEGIF